MPWNLRTAAARGPRDRAGAVAAATAQSTPSSVSRGRPVSSRVSSSSSTTTGVSPASSQVRRFGGALPGSEDQPLRGVPHGTGQVHGPAAFAGAELEHGGRAAAAGFPAGQGDVRARLGQAGVGALTGPGEQVVAGRQDGCARAVAYPGSRGDQGGEGLVPGRCPGRTVRRPARGTAAGAPPAGPAGRRSGAHGRAWWPRRHERATPRASARRSTSAVRVGGPRDEKVRSAGSSGPQNGP